MLVCISNETGQGSGKMAYTKTPMESTDQTKVVPFLHEIDNRSPALAKDTDSLNLLWDIIPNQGTGDGYFQATKREGLQPFDVTQVSEAITGLFYWAQGNVVVACGEFGIQAYFTDGTKSWSSTTVLYSDTSKMIGFTNFAYEDGTNDLIITDGLNLVKVTIAGTVTVITDPDRPVFHRPYPVFLDGYLFLADDKGNIQNSVNNNPTSWNASEFITAEAYPDRITALIRHGVYIVALGSSSVEFFYDAGNPTGTPLAKQSSTTPRIGYMGGLTTYGDNIYFIGIPANGNPTVCEISGLKVSPIGNATIERQIEGTAPNNTGDGVSDFPGHIFTINGHAVYVWKGNNLKTYGLDLTTKLWIRLQTHLSNSPGFNARASTYVDVPPAGVKPFTLISFGNTVNTNLLYAFRETVYQDNGVNFTVQFVSRNLDFGTRRVKFGSRVLLQCDQTPTTSLCFLSWSDDDYQTYSTPRSIDVSHVYPHLYALGQFRKRAWKITYSDNFPMRWQHLELDYSQGQA